VDVTRDASAADCVVQAKAEVMDGLASGRSNALTALLRGELSLEGDRRLLVKVQRLFPVPIGRRATDSSRVVGRRRG
jgi:ubiquinone biosynthesis protein UbiJ